MLVTSEIADALNAQLGRELEAHLQYLAISSYFDAEALPELTRFFAAQAAEEHEHAMKFLDYIQDVGAPVRIPAMPAPQAAFESASEAVELALRAEEDVTARINAIVDLAVKGSDHATQAFLQWFVTEQIEEVSTMSDLLAVIGRAGGNLLLVEDYIARGAGGEGPAVDAGG